MSYLARAGPSRLVAPVLAPRPPIARCFSSSSQVQASPKGAKKGTAGALLDIGETRMTCSCVIQRLLLRGRSRMRRSPISRRRPNPSVFLSRMSHGLRIDGKQLLKPLILSFANPAPPPDLSGLLRLHPVRLALLRGKSADSYYRRRTILQM